MKTELVTTLKRQATRLLADPRDPSLVCSRTKHSFYDKRIPKNDKLGNEGKEVRYCICI